MSECKTNENETAVHTCSVAVMSCAVVLVVVVCRFLFGVFWIWLRFLVFGYIYTTKAKDNSVRAFENIKPMFFTSTPVFTLFLDKVYEMGGFWVDL